MTGTITTFFNVAALVLSQKLHYGSCRYYFYCAYGPHNLVKDAPLHIFPDGLRTTGQHAPLYDHIVPFDKYPKQITGPTVWNPEEYRSNPEKWTHQFTPDQIEELSNAADAFLASKTPLTGISKSNFRVPVLAPYLEELRLDLIDGKGFILFKGFPVQKWGNHKSAIAYMGLGTYLGYFVSQNSRGHVLGHVKDLGEDATQIDKVRIYRTNARQFFHADDSDIVGLLCIAKALEGGESDLVSSHNVYNTLAIERPDVLKTLTEPIWYFDRKGETSKGQDEYIRTSVVYLERGENGRVYTKWDPYYVRSLTRFSDAGIIPPLSAAQLDAIQVLEDTCKRLSLHMVLDIGDIQFLSNAHILHARTEYTDHAPPAPRRHLMRLWLATPESEGGWKLPFWDSNEKKRGGIQVDDQAPVAPLDAE
ncbi:Taurine catabolism dioxygenase TauD/TfdA [Penicillium herquei]|nr:Taurine catabolism dioxygenase TauD/TfdA [Penicillium herquei]